MNKFKKPVSFVLSTTNIIAAKPKVKITSKFS